MLLVQVVGVGPTSGFVLDPRLTALAVLLACAATTLALVTLIRLLRRPSGLSHDLRAMDIVACVVFAIDVAWVAFRADRLTAGAKPDFTAAILPFIGAAYLASLLRTFLWEWHVEKQDIYREALSGAIRSYLEVTIRLLSWYVLLLFPAFLTGHDIPFPVLLGALGSLEPEHALLLLNALQLVWSVLLLVRHGGNSVIERRGRHWAILAGLGIAACLLLVGVRSYAAREDYSMRGIVGLSATYGMVGAAFFAMLVLDTIRCAYLDLFFEATKKPVANHGR